MHHASGLSCTLLLLAIVTRAQVLTPGGGKGAGANLRYPTPLFT